MKKRFIGGLNRVCCGDVHLCSSAEEGCVEVVEKCWGFCGDEQVMLWGKRRDLAG